MMGDYFAHTGDLRFACEIWLPFADAVATFYEQHYRHRDDRGRMVMGVV